METIPQIGNGLDTIIELENPIKVRYETMNLIPLQHLDYRVVGRKAENEGFDIEGDLPDDVLYGGSGSYYVVEVSASCLAVVTHRILNKFWASVKRVEEHSLPEHLKINPEWDISDFPYVESLNGNDALIQHRILVERIQQQYSEHKPKVIYDGYMLISARFSKIS